LPLDALGFGFDNMNDFLRLARVFEDVGVSAYRAPRRLSKILLILTLRPEFSRPKPNIPAPFATA
jgi:hypothetical protein